MNVIMGRRLRKEQDSDKTLHNFTKRRSDFSRLRKKSALNAQPLKGHLNFEGLTASLKRCPDTKLWDLWRWLGLRGLGLLQLSDKLLGLLVGELELTFQKEA